MALPRSRATPLHACPALRPRWCPAHSPYTRSGLLPSGHWKPSAFSLATTLRDILLSTTIPFSGLDHAACILASSSFVRPLLGVHVACAPDRLARLWSGGT